MLPNLLKDVHESGVYRWTPGDCGKKNKNGKKRKLNVAHLTLLGQVCNNFASQVALTSCTYQKIFAAELKKQGRSCKKRGVDAAKKHGHGVSVVYITILWCFL